MPYHQRIIEPRIKQTLEVMGAILLEGSKACGKTETARYFAQSELSLDIDERAVELAKLSPQVALQGNTPHLIDEWQVLPNIWNHVRHEIDNRQSPGQFILTGSAHPTDNITRHSGAGRIARLRMRPMSLFEMGRSNGFVSLQGLLDGKMPDAKSLDLSLEELIELVLRGGWPALLGKSSKAAAIYVESYVEELIHADMERLLKQDYAMSKVKSVLASISRNIACPLNYNTLIRDTFDKASQSQPQVKNSETAKNYIDALTRLMIVENLPAWKPLVRSKARVQNSPKLHFVDPSLATSILGVRPQYLLKDLRTLGLLFESLVVRDIRVYATANHAHVYHYIDDIHSKGLSAGHEVDIIVEAGNTAWAAFEVKLGNGADVLDTAAKNLLMFSQNIEPSVNGRSASLSIITGIGAYAYQREDGVNVIPISCLGA